ncbi:MAG TPA: TRAP transporter large permease [Paenalcaligenes sp.]|nr:TRAP transporter large permease [Paenalcaligenes sp.]
MSSLYWLALAMIGGLFVLLAIGVPIAYALIAVGVFSIIGTQGWAAADYLLGNFPYTSTAEFAFVIIPLFLFMGEMAYLAGLSERAFRVARTWLGHLPGGLPIAAVAACAGFSAVCGSSIVTAATIGRISVPQMLKAGISQKLAGGAVATAGALGALIPPSGILVVYSIATQAPILDLFAAAIVPGVLTAIVYAIGIYLWVRIDPAERRSFQAVRRSTWNERISVLGQGWEIALLFAVVIGSMLLGVATPTEAAAVGAVVASVIAIWRGVGKKGFRQGLAASGSSTASVFLLIVGSGIFSLGFATTQVAQDLAIYMSSLDLPPFALVILLLLPFFVLGMFLDAISMILLTMPIIFPIVEFTGIHPVLFGILVTKMAEISNITPPVGLNVFVLQGVAPELKIGNVFKGVMPFILMELLLIGLFIAFPEIVLFAVN